ncbi:MAG: Unknown protein [uncultured Thiotrichaceae bacterium]|uniref:Uncharacterized protein n=1 Tax=uncultured Thiotrichaceae bacterium TaxID=298394 RepID=A0A6S6TW39_9GAMM|nr:MAG: Unknown protein [uncultured Thiotrichaceae bacterium]
MDEREIVLTISEHTFQYLEVLAVGLSQEAQGVDNEALKAGYDKRIDDYGPLVAKLLEDVAGSLADGVRRPGAWERGVVDQLTGWNSTVYPDKFGDLVDIPIKD